MSLLDYLVEKARRGAAASSPEAVTILSTRDDDLLDVVADAARLRRRYFGCRVKLNYLWAPRRRPMPERQPPGSPVDRRVSAGGEVQQGV